MAIAATTIWEMNSGATASNANGGGFNPGNAGMLADLTTNANTANTASPVVSSASYNFVSGDVGNWLYIKSGTSWTPGFYKIASVAANKATLTASIGTADQLLNGFYAPNTVVGCATVGTPTSGTFTIDYSRSLACITSTAVANYNAVGASVTLTSATAGFTPVMVGNIFFQSTTGTGAFGTIGRYEIATYVNATTVTLDRTPNSGTASVNTTGKIGGAYSLGAASDTTAFSTPVAGNLIYIVGNATYTAGSGIGAGTAGTQAAPINVIGYVTQRGDNPTGSTRPLLAMATQTFTLATMWNISFVQFTGTAGTVAAIGNTAVCRYQYCKATNKSTTAGRNAFSVGNYPSTFIGCEGVSYAGIGFAFNTAGGGGAVFEGCYAHDSNIGFSEVTANSIYTITNCIAAANITDAISVNTATTSTKNIISNTLVGRTTSKLGIGIAVPATSSSVNVMNNIITGFATGISVTTAIGNNYGDYNDFYNNTADVANWNKGNHDLAVDPAFTSANERTGTTATTTSGNHLVQSGATFVTWGITAGQDCVYISAGTGVTAGIYGILSVDSETQITVDITLTANATADKVWSIQQNGNYQIGSALKGVGFPGAFPSGVTTGYLDIGAVQRQEGTGGGTPAWAS